MKSALAAAAAAALTLFLPGLAQGSGSSRPLATAPSQPAPTGDVRISFDWAMTFDCGGPPMPFAVTEWPGALHGVLGLNRDRSYSIDLNYQAFLGTAWTLRWDGRLGGRPVQMRGGAAELRVAGPHSLRAIVHEPNNDVIINVDADQSNCRLAVDSRLHPGKTEHTFYSGLPEDEDRFYHCSGIRTVAASCQAQ